MIMFNSKNNKFYLTRGDEMIFDLQIKTDDGVHIFQEDDVITFAVYKDLKKPALILEKFYPVVGSDTVQIDIPSEKTKLENLVSYPRQYFYEIIFNEVNTIMGYSDKGEAILELLPEGTNVKEVLSNEYINS